MSRERGLVSPLGLLCAAVLAGPAWAQIEPERPYFGRTILWGSGIIVTPTADVPPGKFNVAGTGGAYVVETPTAASANPGGALTIGILGFFEGGVSVYSDEDAAAFGKIRLVRGSRSFPAIAAGVLNVTGRDVGRFGNTDPVYSDFSIRTVWYGVLTYTVEPGEDAKPIWLELSAGWGSGFFHEEIGLFSTEIDGNGFFGSAAFDFKVGPDHFVRIMGEYDSWNINVGAMLMLGGMEISAGILAIDGKTEDTARQEDQLRPYLALTIDATTATRWPGILKGAR